jgi:tetratricopeptide (TPR) repeat protein
MTSAGDIGELVSEASRQYSNGQFSEAAAICSAALAIYPDEPAAMHLAGLCQLAQGQSDAGIELLEKAFAREPGNDELRTNLALARSHRGEHQAVVDLLGSLLLRRPDNLPIYQPLAMAKWELGDRTGAIAVYRGLVERSPYDAASHQALGDALMQAGDAEQALALLQRAAYLQPENVDLEIKVLEARCAAIMRLPGGHPDEAAAAADVRALLERVTETSQEVRLAILSHRLNDIEFAIEKFRQLGGEFATEQALSILVELAIASSKILRILESESFYRQAIGLVPHDTPANLNLSLLDLLQERFEEGWARYETRRPLLPHVLPHPAYGEEPWRVEGDLAGRTVRVVLEQGLGDTLQFIRYIPMLADRGARVELAVPIHQTLLPLIRSVRGLAAEVTDAGAEPVPDVVVPLLSLPLAFGTNAANIPSDVPYLAPPQERREKWRRIMRERLAGDDVRPKVGVVWSGSSTHANDRHRSIPLAMFRRVLAREDISFHCLSDRLRDGDSTELGDLAVVHSGLDDFADTAALVELMDLVIGVDTSVIHLAGALGRPVWAMLPAHPDWRWLLGRNDSPWYPTLRLFRQPQHLDWATVLDDVAAALEEQFPR